MSSLKESEEQTSPPATPLSLGVQVANSHFSKISASKGNKGCLKERESEGGVRLTVPETRSTKIQNNDL